ncbi:MAG: CoB--CoM heterodisulfide reductase iron-sulfur subunit A family protein [Dehalococcoidia bacterium]|nr:CoB--CoM heterodisulfide reductase iron-sulfur subunit A family protein [Dehalococcoidia bacterium]
MAIPRIGVFICHCGTNIGGIVNVPEVVEYAKGLPYVVYAEANMYTCSEEGISSIKNNIKEHNLNRVVVASCTPRTHQPLFRNACADAGLNPYLFEFVNIREHCSWIHMQNRQEATEKAKELVKMGVAKARWLEAQEEFESDVYPAAMVIGGGVAGMSAALNLANQGFDVHLVEKEPELGGRLLKLNRVFPINKDPSELVESIVKAVEGHSKIRLHMPAVVKAASGYIGNFDVSVDEDGQETSFKVGVIIVATGAQVLKPELYRYGELANVLTQLDLEQRLKDGGLGEVQKVVMINCVGARIPERPYCSRLCCMTAIKNAALMKEINPEAKVYVLHRDLMTYGVEFEEYYREAKEAGVRFIRYTLSNPPQVIGAEKVEAVKVYDELMDMELELPCDLLVLATPLIPNEDNEELSRMLKVPIGDGGFFLEAHVKLRPVEFSTDGIYVAGSCRWPADIRESIAQGYAAASEAVIPLRQGMVKVEAITATVDPKICKGCGTCVLVCPFDAIELKESKIRGLEGKIVSEVNTALCKGCGLCAAACPNRAIQQRGFTDMQLLSMVNALSGKR